MKREEEEEEEEEKGVLIECDCNCVVVSGCVLVLSVVVRAYVCCVRGVCMLWRDEVGSERERE